MVWCFLDTVGGVCMLWLWLPKKRVFWRLSVAKETKSKFFCGATFCCHGDKWWHAVMFLTCLRSGFFLVIVVLVLDGGGSAHPPSPVSMYIYIYILYSSVDVFWRYLLWSLECLSTNVGVFVALHCLCHVLIPFCFIFAY